MKKSTVAILCAGMLATGFVLGKSCNMDIKEPIESNHEIQFFVDRIEEKEWIVVEVYDETTNSVTMVDIKTEEGYKVSTNGWTSMNFNFEED